MYSDFVPFITLSFVFLRDHHHVYIPGGVSPLSLPTKKHTRHKNYKAIHDYPGWLRTISGKGVYLSSCVIL